MHVCVCVCSCCKQSYPSGAGAGLHAAGATHNRQARALGFTPPARHLLALEGMTRDGLVELLAESAREREWLRSGAPNREDLAVLRVVCRNGFGHDLAEVFVNDLRHAVTQLAAEAHSATASGPAGFRH